MLLGECPFLLVERQSGQDLQVDAPAPPGLAHELREFAGDHVENGGPLGRRLVAELQEVAFAGSRRASLELDQISAGRTSPAGGQRRPHAGHPLGVARLPSRLARLLRHGPRSLARVGQQHAVPTIALVVLLGVVGLSANPVLTALAVLQHNSGLPA